MWVRLRSQIRRYNSARQIKQRMAAPDIRITPCAGNVHRRLSGVQWATPYVPSVPITASVKPISHGGSLAMGSRLLFVSRLGSEWVTGLQIYTKSRHRSRLDI